MEKNEFNDFSDDSTDEVIVSDDLTEDSDEDKQELNGKCHDENLVRRRRRLECMLEAKRLSKQLFDYENEEEIDLDSYYDEVDLSES